MEMSENKTRMLQGEVYFAFTPELVNDRRRCQEAILRYNDSKDVSRRKRVELWREIVGDKTPLPPKAVTDEEDEALFGDDCWVEPPFHADYGTNLEFGQNVFVNFNASFIDTCKISIGARTLFGPNVSLFSGRHPLDPEVRNGTKGPEDGAEIHIGEDCWLGGNVVVLPGITIGKGSVVGAGSVVTKDVPPYTIVAGNPARKIRDAPRDTKAEITSAALAALQRDEAKNRDTNDNGTE